MDKLNSECAQFFGSNCVVEFSTNRIPVDQYQVTSALQELRAISFTEIVRERFLTVPTFKGTESPEYISQFWRSRSVVVKLIQHALNQGLRAEKIFFSLSHAKDACVAIACERFSVGVDLESTERPINLQLASRISQTDEKISNLTALQVWVIKEACFKANLQNSGTTLPEYQIVEEKNQRGIVKFQGAGFGDFNFMVLQANGYTIAFAGAVKN